MTKIHTNKQTSPSAVNSATSAGHKRLGLEPALAQLWSNRRHLLDTVDLNLGETQAIMELANRFEKLANDRAPYPVLEQKTLANIFYENSTRTRSSFELAARRLGVMVLNLDVSGSSVAKGESLADTARTLISMGVDAIVQRHSASGSAKLMSQLLGDRVHVINAGDGWHAHPTQALLDLYTMNQVHPDLRGKKVAIVGDVLHSRVARSNIFLLNKHDMDIHVAGPPALVPTHIEELGVTYQERLEDALRGADFVMALRLQLERQRQGLISSIDEYKKLFQINHQRLKVANEGVRVLHPGPANRGIEITDQLHDDEQISLVSRQVRSGVFVRMAVLYLLMS